MRHQQHSRAGLRVGLALLACGLALGAASAVAVVNALYDFLG